MKNQIWICNSKLHYLGFYHFHNQETNSYSLTAYSAYLSVPQHTSAYHTLPQSWNTSEPTRMT